MEIQCPQTYKNLLYLLEETEGAEFARQSLDIKHISKAKTYIMRYAINTLYLKYRKSLRAFACGFHCKLPIDLSQHYNPNEVKLFIKGTTDQITFKQL